MTTGSSIQCVHWIERGRFSGYRFWNRVPSSYRSRDIALFMSKKRSSELFPGHVTTGSGIEYVHCLERGRFSGYRSWNCVPSPYRSRDNAIFMSKNRSRQLFPGHVTTGSSTQCVHWIERGQFSGCGFWNRVSSPYHTRVMAISHA